MNVYDLFVYPLILLIFGRIGNSFIKKCPYSTMAIGRISSKIIIGLLKVSSQPETKPNVSRLINNKKCLEIPYVFGTTNYIVYIPFCEGLTKRGLNVKFTPNEPDESNPERFITQQAGVPYLVSPSDIGGIVEIININLDNKIVQTFKDNDLIHCYSDKYKTSII